MSDTTIDDLPLEILSIILDYPLTQNTRAFSAIITVSQRFYAAVKAIPRFNNNNVNAMSLVDTVSVIAYNINKINIIIDNIKSQLRPHDIYIHYRRDNTLFMHECSARCYVGIMMTEDKVRLRAWHGFSPRTGETSSDSFEDFNKQTSNMLCVDFKRHICDIYYSYFDTGKPINDINRILAKIKKVIERN